MKSWTDLAGDAAEWWRNRLIGSKNVFCPDFSINLPTGPKCKHDLHVCARCGHGLNNPEQPHTTHGGRGSVGEALRGKKRKKRKKRR